VDLIPIIVTHTHERVCAAGIRVGALARMSMRADESGGEDGFRGVLQGQDGFYIQSHLVMSLAYSGSQTPTR
jgi:hypothetical protein